MCASVRTPEIAARVFRGKTVEAEHTASIAVIGSDNKLTHLLGNPALVTMTRSSIKPFQAIPLVASGAADTFKFDDHELAIMCGSHNGTDAHREVVLSILDKAGNRVDHLQCGTHLPMAMQQDKTYPLKGEDDDPTRHNCSGKHAGFLALARYFGDSIDRYLNASNLSQGAVKEAVANFCEFPSGQMDVAVDGCSAPNFSLPLQNLALGFKKLASADIGDQKLRTAVTRIRSAMWKYPEMVSGEGRFDLALARSFPNNCVCKVGAEAIEGIGFADPPIGIVVKIHDGNWRALWPVCIEVLTQLGIIKDINKYPLLKPHRRPRVFNFRGLDTGEIICDFSLHSV